LSFGGTIRSLQQARLAGEIGIAPGTKAVWVRVGRGRRTPGYERPFLTVAWAAATRAIGTRNGEHET
jgi:hypothetical protein